MSRRIRWKSCLSCIWCFWWVHLSGLLIYRDFTIRSSWNQSFCIQSWKTNCTRLHLSDRWEWISFCPLHWRKQLSDSWSPQRDHRFWNSSPELFEDSKISSNFRLQLRRLKSLELWVEAYRRKKCVQSDEGKPPRNVLINRDAQFE